MPVEKSMFFRKAVRLGQGNAVSLRSQGSIDLV
jgi:hypothetical protein